MAHTVLYNAELQIIEIKIEGEYRPEEGKEVICEVLRMIQVHQCTRTLADMREAKVKFSLQDLFRIPNLLRDMSSNMNIPPYKRAIVIKKQTSEMRFFENVMANRGQYVKIFFDMEEAQAWLLS